MRNTLQLEIVLPEAAIPARAIRGIDVQAADGRLTLLANHQPLIAALVPGTAIITTADGTREIWQLSAGALQMENNTATLLVAEAVAGS
jgi:F-type H+-transporting ATPase subunit epsilon